jgi:hypothetical protein
VLVDPELAERARAQLADDHEPARIEQTTRRRRSRFNALVAVIVLAAALGGAAAIWVRYDDHPTIRPPQRSRGVAGVRHVINPRRSRRKAGGGSGTSALLRPPSFHVPGAPKEPLDEISLPARARRLSAWLTPPRHRTAWNERHWLYQHAWIVSGAKFGWWHGAAALRVLIRVDRRIESRWGIGQRSEAVARNALAAVEARAK